MLDMKRFKWQGGDLIDIHTGEVIEFGGSVSQVINDGVGEGMFARLYLEALCEDFQPDKLKPAAQRLFWYLVKQGRYIKQTIPFGAESKSKMMKELDMVERTFRDSYYQLRDYNYLIFLAHNEIQINPKIIARGNEIDIVAMKQSIVKATDGKYYRITEFGTRDKKYDHVPHQYDKYLRTNNENAPDNKDK